MKWRFSINQCRVVGATFWKSGSRIIADNKAKFEITFPD